MKMHFTIFVLCAINYCLGQNINSPPLDWIETDGTGAYQFGYATGDKGRHYRVEAATANNRISGKFGYKDPATGRDLQTIYTAGRRGFRARGPHIARRMDLSQDRPPFSRPNNDGQYRPELDNIFDPNEDRGYDFSYRIPGHVKEEHANRVGDVQGRYAYQDDIGFRHNVNYIAGSRTGFVVSNPVPDTFAQARGGPLYYVGKTGGAKVRGFSAVQKNLNGAYRFLASGPDHKRSEISDASGNRRGIYTYLDDKGVQHTVEYIAGPKIGYKVINNKRGVNYNPVLPFFPDSSTVLPLFPSDSSTGKPQGSFINPSPSPLPANIFPTIPSFEDNAFSLSPSSSFGGLGGAEDSGGFGAFGGSGGSGGTGNSGGTGGFGNAGDPGGSGSSGNSGSLGGSGGSGGFGSSGGSGGSGNSGGFVSGGAGGGSNSGGQNGGSVSSFPSFPSAGAGSFPSRPGDSANENLRPSVSSVPFSESNKPSPSSIFKPSTVKPPTSLFTPSSQKSFLSPGTSNNLDGSKDFTSPTSSPSSGESSIGSSFPDWSYNYDYFFNDPTNSNKDWSKPIKGQSEKSSTPKVPSINIFPDFFPSPFPEIGFPDSFGEGLNTAESGAGVKPPFGFNNKEDRNKTNVDSVSSTNVNNNSGDDDRGTQQSEGGGHVFNAGGKDTKDHSGKHYYKGQKGIAYPSRGTVKFGGGEKNKWHKVKSEDGYFSIPPGVAVRAHVQSLDIVPFHKKFLSPGEALKHHETNKKKREDN